MGARSGSFFFLVPLYSQELEAELSSPRGVGHTLRGKQTEVEHIKLLNIKGGLRSI